MPLTLSELLSLSNREFLRESYRTYLSRDIDESGEAYYLRRLSLGYNKIDILYDLRRSDEFCATPADLATLNEYFRRNGNTGAWGIRSLRRASYILRRLSSLQDQLATAVEANATFNIIPSETKPTTQDTFAESKSSATPSEITQNSNTRDLSHPATAASHFPPIAGQPLISVIIVNYNGSLHLPELGESLKKQTYKNFEVVFVDNNSSDDSIAIATRCLPNIKIVASKQNTGFAEGNNLGLEKSTGDLLFLLNNDTRIAPDCLAQLLSVFTGKTHKQVGAVVPKIQFFKPFSTIEIEAPFPFTLDPESLLQQCPLYKKIIPQSPLAEPRTTQVFLLPAPLPSLHIILSIDNPPTYRDTGNPSISVSVDGRRIEKFGISFENDCIELHLPEVVTGGTAVINNVGSYVHPNGDCGDIGIYELDRGQYDNEREVDALCGCAALIRRDALGNFPLFASDFFAYYEDTELSIRLRSGGWKIIYTPLALVNHKHAATSDDKSANFRYLVARNRLLFLAIHFKHLLAEKLTESMRTWNHFVSVNSPEIFPEPAQQEFVRRLPSLMAELPGMLSRIYYGTFFLRRNAFPRIGIFNEYWGTLGGGELRALRLAEVLSQYFIVD
jgi:GT2 family glycosyltransferase